MIIIADKLITRSGREFDNGSIVIRSGKVLECGIASRMVSKYPGHQVIRLEHAVLMPGLVNVHAHLELPSLPGLVQGKDYAGWVLALLKAKSGLTFRDYLSASRNNTAAVIRSGTTTIAEICTHGASLPQLARSGLRAVVFHEIITMAQEVGIISLPHPGRYGRLIRQGFSPHSPHTVSEAALDVIRRHALKRGMPLCMHVAETMDEIRLLQGRKSRLQRIYDVAGWKTSWAPHARSSFAYLQRTGILNRSFLAVHAVHADAADRAIIKRAGAGIAHCPRSNSSLRTGKMPLAEFLKEKIPVGLGTDSLASVSSLNLWDEMRYAYRIHRSSGITAEDIIGLATLGGAKAIGKGNEVGSLEPGKKADCIALPLPRKMTGDLYSDLLRETTSCIMSMVNGRIIYRVKANTSARHEP